jgi:hypothetical protein
MTEITAELNESKETTDLFLKQSKIRMQTVTKPSKAKQYKTL